MRSVCSSKIRPGATDPLRALCCAISTDAVAAGRVALDADVRHALPALAGCAQPVRLGHLLRHTSGVDDYLYLWHMQLGHDEDDLVTQEQALALIRRAGDVDVEPGERHEYSNSNYVLLAGWLERDSGRPLDEIARDRFFAPWGLSNTSHGTNAVLARCSGDEPRIGPADHPYAFGIEVMTHGPRRLLVHGGGFAGFSSLVLRSLEDGLALIVLANVEGFDASAKTWHLGSGARSDLEILLDGSLLGTVVTGRGRSRTADSGAR